MANPKDILLDDDFDLLIVDGDFVIGDSTVQNEKLLLLLNEGEIKQYPDATVGAGRYKDDEGPSALLQKISEKFVGDGMKVNKVAVENGKIVTNAIYK
ncbi:hypothetical protein CJD36_019825 [Flavipsychrobacter stenotrophus]|uniref:Oxidase n=1 Tax=Flavipsychrobacter stenotrophus TaxID=2077091 RepID=A0A2S7SS84_9BACT|nr:hypothetical protein [Flavipsychrobacter stenotrophus]PQJ09491.1 hypothetical protein CJD36_019825 [Flavipsychrobacter stenotrophus]